MSKKRVRIADIQTSALLYYDPDFQTESYQFCRDRKIDCLPLVGDDTAFYKRNDDTAGFEPRKITAERKINASTFIFRPDLLERFRQHPLLFVFENDELTGVVHFSDYNKRVVSNYLFSLLFDYEKSLRTLATLSRLTNEDMGAYFEEKLAAAQAKGKKVEYFENKVGYYQRKQYEMKRLPEFQVFYLEDLISLLNHREVMDLNGSVRDLRNAIMHAHELVDMVDVTTPDFIYDFESFKIFFERVQIFLHDAQRVKNRIVFVSRTELPT